MADAMIAHAGDAHMKRDEGILFSGGAAGAEAAFGACAERRVAAEARPAPIIVLAVAVAAIDANRPSAGVGGDDGVQAIGFADAAEVFNRFAGAVGSW